MVTLTRLRGVDLFTMQEAVSVAQNCNIAVNKYKYRVQNVRW